MCYSTKLASPAHATAIIEIIDNAKLFLREQGLTQWQNGYPNLSTIENDIALQRCYLIEKDSTIAGLFCLCVGEEPTYNTIYNGTWLTQNTPYATVHRVAVNQNFRGSGVASLLLQQAEIFAKESGNSSVRVDTHPQNMPMQGLLIKNGYAKCGTIYLTEEKTPLDERVAFEKVLL